MQEPDQSELTDSELDALLREWKTPLAPPGLRSSLFPARAMPWHRRLFGASIRIPVPLAAALCVLLVLSGWRWGSVRERARILDGLASPASPATLVTFHGFSPVSELRPRIIRSHHAAN